MTRKLFFSFHFGRDAWRAGQVRNSDLIPNEDEHGFIDAVDWEEVQRKGPDSIKRWIDEQFEGTSVTVVLIGAETHTRKWVNYEIRESWKRGNAIIGIYIHQVRNPDQSTDTAGINPLDRIHFTDGTTLSSVCPTYDWVDNDGRNNLGTWAEEAFNARQGITKTIDDTEGGTPAQTSAAPRPFAPGPVTPPLPPRNREVG